MLSRVMYLPPVSGTLTQEAYTPITRYVAYGLMDGGLSERLNRESLLPLLLLSLTKGMVRSRSLSAQKQFARLVCLSAYVSLL